MRARRYATTLCLTMILLAVVPTVAWAGQAFPFPPTQPSTPAQPAVDPRVAQIRQWLEAKGFRVIEVEWRRRSSGDPQWWTETAARYAQPSGDKVIDQAFFMWAAMYEFVKQDDARTYLSTSQLWTKYLIVLHVRLSQLTAYVNAHRAAGSDAERSQAYNTFLSQATIAVFDVERGQQVDEKDFANKNFTR